MKAKTILLAGVALLLTTAAASAQFRRGGGYGMATPFGTAGNPYAYNNGYYGNSYNSYNNGYYGSGYNTFGYNQFNTPTYVQPQPGVTYSQSQYFSSPSTTAFPQTVTTRRGTTLVYPQGTVVQSGFTTPNTTAATTPSAMGLKITEVKPNGPADKAGLRTNDVILKVDDKRTQSFDDLRSALSTATKTDVTVEFWSEQNGKKETKKVQVKDTKFGVMVVETPVNETKVNQ